MPWLSDWSHPIPEEDLISYTFDHCDYDKDAPVGHHSMTIARGDSDDLF